MKDKINLEKAKLSNTALSHYDGKKKNPKMTRSLVLKCSYISFSFFFLVCQTAGHANSSPFYGCVLGCQALEQE